MLKGEGRGGDHAANAGICLAARLPAPHHLSALSRLTKEKKKMIHEKKHFLTQDVNHTANIPGLAAK